MKPEIITWRAEITEAMEKHREDWSGVVSCSISESELDRQFPRHEAVHCTTGFTLWTKNRCYFAMEYDGSGFVGSVSRNPDGISVFL